MLFQCEEMLPSKDTVSTLKHGSTEEVREITATCIPKTLISPPLVESNVAKCIQHRELISHEQAFK